MKNMNRIIIIFLFIFFVNGEVLAENYQVIEDIKDIPINRHIKHVFSKNLGAIMPGAGYSHDSQQIPPNVCYNTVVASKTGQQGIINLNTAMSFYDFELQTHFNIDISGNFGMFSSEAEADYFRSIQDLDYSLSLNYNEILFNNVMLSLAGVEQKALTDSGKEIYNDPDTKKYFGILCGDDYVSSYQQGAVLLMGINLRFHSHLDKEEFSARTKESSFGNIVSASSQIQAFSKQYNIHGTAIIQAFQKGGNPVELSKILAKDEKGTYYALSCDIQNMDNCVKAANGLLKYAADNFPKQVSFIPEKGLVPLGIGFLRHDPIAEYGLSPPPSLVTKEIKDDRIFLAKALKENQYYQQKLDLLLHAYDVPWEIWGGDMYKTAKSLYKYSTNNIDFITVPNNPDDGALKCYSHPQFCHELTEKIKNQIKPITPYLNFLEPLKTMMVDVDRAYLWYPLSNPSLFFKRGATGWWNGYMTITEKGLKDIALRIEYPTDQQWVWARRNEGCKDGDIYISLLYPEDYPKHREFYIRLRVLPNPFYFNAYKPEIK